MKRLPLLTLVALAFSINAHAQQPRNPEPAGPQVEDAKLMLDLFMAEQQMRLVGKSENAERLAELYARIARDPRLTTKVIGQSVGQYYGLREGAKSAMQASQAADEASIKMMFLQAAQNQAIIEQNKRIIELLELIAKKK